MAFGIKSLFEKFGGKLTSAVTVVSSQSEPESWIEYMDADRVSFVLRCARGGNVQPLFALYRDIVLSDSHLQGEFSKRKLAVLGDQYRVVPKDKTEQSDMDAAEFCRNAITDLSSWRTACSHLLDSTLWPVAVVEKVYESAGAGFQLKELIPVPHHLLDFSSGKLMISDTDEKGTVLKSSHEPDPARYIVHRGHLITAPDNFGGPMRSLIYWWLGSTMTRDWWVRFLDRYGMPFMVGKYAAGNDADKNILVSALSAAKKLFGLAVSRDTDVEIVEASKSGADAFERFQAICQLEKSKLILGQTLSATSSATGMGSGVATLQGDVRDDIRKFDAQILGDTLRDSLFRQLCQINRLSGRPPSIVWGSASNSDLKAMADILSTLGQAGLEVDDEAIPEVSEKIGITLRRKSAPDPVSPAFSPTDPVTPDQREQRFVALSMHQDRLRAAAVLSDAMALHATLGTVNQP